MHKLIRIHRVSESTQHAKIMNVKLLQEFLSWMRVICLESTSHNKLILQVVQQSNCLHVHVRFYFRTILCSSLQKACHVDSFPLPSGSSLVSEARGFFFLSRVSFRELCMLLLDGSERHQDMSMERHYKVFLLKQFIRPLWFFYGCITNFNVTSSWSFCCCYNLGHSSKFQDFRKIIKRRIYYH